MDDVFLFDPTNSRFLTSEYLQHPLITKSPEVMRSEQSVFYRGRWIIAPFLLAALVAATAFLLITIPHMLGQYASIVLPIVFVVWFPTAYVLVNVILRQFTLVYDPTHDIALEDSGVVVLGEVQAIDWIKHRQSYWLTVRAHHPDVPDTTLHTAVPTTSNPANQPQPGTKVALLYSGVWGTPFYKAEAL